MVNQAHRWNRKDKVIVDYLLEVLSGKVLLRRFENIREQKTLFKQLREQFFVVEKVERTKPDGTKEIIRHFVLKKNN